MFAQFNYDNFPFVIVKFNKKIKDQSQFNYFLQEWFFLNNLKKSYSLIFDTTKVEYINPKYALKMAQFIKKLKENDITFIKETILILNNNFLRYLIKIILKIQKPSAPIYIVPNINLAIIVCKKLLTHNTIQGKNITIVNP